MGQGWTLQAQEGFTVNPHQLLSLSTLEVSEEAEAILAKALQQHHAGGRFPISVAKSGAPWSEPLPTGCLSTPTPVPPDSALSVHSGCPLPLAHGNLSWRCSMTPLPRAL